MTSQQRFLPTNGLPTVAIDHTVHRSTYRSTAARIGTALGVAAVVLAGLAVANVYAARAAERRNPPKGRFLSVDGVRLHYIETDVGIEAGGGSPVALLHGNVATADDFIVSGLFGRLARHHRVIAIDRPGMGHSERPRGPLWTPAEQATLLRRAFDRLGIERPIVVGHSFGATVAAAMALDHPGAVGGVVLLSGYYFPTARIDVLLAALPATPVLGDALNYTLSPPFGAAIMPLLLKAIFAPMPIPDHFSTLFPVSLAVRPSQIRASAQDGTTMVPAADAMQSRYQELTMPVAILYGNGDRIVDPAAQSIRLHRVIPQSTLHQVRRAGHMVHYADTALVTEIIEGIAARSGVPL